MNLAFVQSVVTHLNSYGFGTPGADLWAMTMPNTPQVATAVILSGGFNIPGDPIRRPSVQIVHRNTHIDSGLTTVGSLHKELNEKWNVLCDSRGRLEAQSEPGPYFKDEANLYVFSLNFVFVTTIPK